MIKTTEGIEQAIQRVEISRLVELLVNAGAVSQTAAIEFFSGLAEIVRDAKVAPSLRRYADQKALHYEDMANLMRGGSLPPRDPM
ncbi:hypothetical protein [Mesorhizobium sp. 1M-11]|uniref:hypothetical protein n=1 Tax=Mesorhizobium sp. 1M-11 TaxID=1529006 RepID=UPI0006C7662A|nr:hypothetical protein [Mesorhizobium sp. 1M-11]